MAWRPNKHLIEGELSNIERGVVTGKMTFLGMSEPVLLSLKGDFHRDIRGASIRFTGSPNYGDFEKSHVYMQGFSSIQTGHVGDITAGKVPRDYADYPYIEWYSEENGRVVLELRRDQVVVIGEPLPWQKEEPVDPRIGAARLLEFLAGVARDISEDLGGLYEDRNKTN